METMEMMERWTPDDRTPNPTTDRIARLEPCALRMFKGVVLLSPFTEATDDDGPQMDTERDDGHR